MWEFIDKTEQLPGDLRMRIRCIVIWHWIGDARMQQHRGWRCACIASTCHTIFPNLHFFCVLSSPNYVVSGMQVVHLDLLAVHSRMNRLVMLRPIVADSDMSLLMRSFRLLLPTAVALPCCSWPSDPRHCHAYAASSSILGH